MVCWSVMCITVTSRKDIGCDYKRAKVEGLVARLQGFRGRVVRGAQFGGGMDQVDSDLIYSADRLGLRPHPNLIAARQ